MIASTAEFIALRLADMRETFLVHVMAYLELTWLVYKHRFVAIFMGITDTQALQGSR